MSLRIYPHWFFMKMWKGIHFTFSSTLDLLSLVNMIKNKTYFMQQQHVWMTFICILTLKVINFVMFNNIVVKLFEINVNAHFELLVHLTALRVHYKVQWLQQYHRICLYFVLYTAFEALSLSVVQPCIKTNMYNWWRDILSFLFLLQSFMHLVFPHYHMCQKIHF